MTSNSFSARLSQQTLPNRHSAPGYRYGRSLIDANFVVLRQHDWSFSQKRGRDRRDDPRTRSARTGDRPPRSSSNKHRNARYLISRHPLSRTRARFSETLVVLLKSPPPPHKYHRVYKALANDGTTTKDMETRGSEWVGCREVSAFIERGTRTRSV